MNWKSFFQRVRYNIVNYVNSLMKPRHLFISEVMQFRFIEFKTKKIRYDISKHYYTLSLKNKDDIYKYLFSLLMLLLIFLLPFMSKDVGLSADEIRKNENAKAVYEYYADGNQAVKSIPDLIYQGQAIDNLAYAINQWFGFDDFLVTRHLINSFFGWLIILVTGLLLVRLFCWRAAFFGALFLFISPRFLGPVFSDLVDVPFAFAYIFTIFQILLFCFDLPVIKWNRIFYITLAISLATMITDGGFVLILYLFAFVVLYFISQNPIKKFFTKKYLISFFQLLALLTGITVVVYLVDFIYLPGELHATAVSPFEAVSLLKNNIHPSVQLFEGHFFRTESLPHYYLFKMMFITIPFVLLLGFLIHFLLLKKVIGTIRLFSEIVLLVAFFYPFFVGNNGNINPDNDWSLFLFIYPVFVVLAVGGMEAILRKIDDFYTNIVITGIFLLLSIMPLRHVIFNHPVSYVYYNEISGGIDNAYGKYPLDYNEQINKLTARSLIKYIDNQEVKDSVGTQKIIVFTDGGQGLQYFLRNDTSRISLGFCEYDKLDSTTNWNYFISFANNKTSQQLKNKTWLHDGTFNTLKLERKPIVAFIKNPRDTIEAIPLE
jgi:hypothetical protein